MQWVRKACLAEAMGKAARRRGAKGKGTEKARKVALVRALSKLGLASRSQAYELVRSGKVEVNGRSRDGSRGWRRSHRG